MLVAVVMCMSARVCYPRAQLLQRKMAWVYLLFPCLGLLYATVPVRNKRPIHSSNLVKCYPLEYYGGGGWIAFKD